MNKEEFEKQRAAFEAERVALEQQIEKGEITQERADEKIKELQIRRQQLEQERARLYAPNNEEKDSGVDFEQIRTAMLERRSISLVPELGGQKLIADIVQEMAAKTPLLSMVATYNGTDASTVIPILHPGLAQPVGYAEGAKNIAEDTQAKLSIKEVNPFPFASILPITYTMLKFDKIGFESKLTGLFSDVFARCFHEQIINGKGSAQKQFEGLMEMTFDAGKTVTAAASGKLSVTDLAELALTLSDKTDSGCIIMHPSVYSKICADSPKQDLSAVYLKQLIENKSIEGVKIVLTSYMPKDTASGKVAVVAGDLKRYAFAIAGQMDIIPKMKVGDANVYFEVYAYANGLPVINDFYCLKAK